MCKEFHGSQRKKSSPVSPDPDVFGDPDDSPRPAPQRGKRRNWRKEHEELLNNMKNARRAARAQKDGKPMPPPPPPTEHPGVYTNIMCLKLTCT